MEVYQTKDFYIFVRQDSSLWWNRTTSEFLIKPGWDFSSVDDIECIGITTGIVGVISMPKVYPPHLVIVKEASPVGALFPPFLAYKIKSICILSDDEPDTILLPCPRHSKANGATSSVAQTSSLWNTFTSKIRPNRDSVEKRITDELHKVFDDSDSFYFCPDADITNNLQRRRDGERDERFFWNRHMLDGILALNEPSWVLPVIQGFIQMENCVINNECFTLAIVSRRSRHRAGTRYKRRGVDDNGNCANYVETEQILSYRRYQMSFTQVRGSVPVFWSQPGYKYRPPPRLDKNFDESQLSFKKHFDRELSTYDSIYIVNLVDQTGKEKVIFDTYGEHIVKLNSEHLTYVTFDFHDYCRGMRFENVSALIEAVAPEVGAMGFTWHDAQGEMCRQRSVFRVNCMDCLDRTNVVQTAFGRAVLQSQLVRLGVAPPYAPIPEQLKQPFMMLWANNGDIISRQYAGTNALKGDYTRTGQRKLSGMVKDGMNSANRYVIQHFDDHFRQCVIDLMHGHLLDVAQLHEEQTIDKMLAVCQTLVSPLVPAAPNPNRNVYSLSVFRNEMWLTERLVHMTSYYLARFKDAYRQATIDLMLGNHVSRESLMALGGQTAPEDAGDAADGAEQAKLLVEDCRRMLLGSNQNPIGAWGLIDADPNTGDQNETEVDSILLLTEELYIVAEYDSHLDKIVRFERVPLDNVCLVEFGIVSTKLFQASTSGSHPCLRLNYTVDGEDGYFHMFRSANIRFFNSMADVITSPDEVTESMLAIVEFFRIALHTRGRADVPFITKGSLQMRKSRTPMLNVPGMPRNLSESHLVQIGSKALSNVAGQFSKLGQSLNPVKFRTSKPTLGSNPTIVYSPSTASLETGVIADEESMARFTIGDEHLVTDSDEDLSLYQPKIGQDLQKDAGDAFLPSVGIVMASTSGVELVADTPTTKRCSADVGTLSITSVTDHVNMPSGMMECGPAIRPRSPAPEIRVDGVSASETAATTSGMAGRGKSSLSHSSSEVRSDEVVSSSMAQSQSMNRNMSLNLSSSQSENAIKQLKTLTSPLSKLATGMKSIGMNLDPRKMSSAKSPIADELPDMPRNDSVNQRLHEQWDSSKCKTKLIAL